jgi:hypothetical protein
VRAFLLLIVLTIAMPGIARAALPAVVPAPRSVQAVRCAHSVSLEHPLHIAASLDGGGYDEIGERWKALGIPIPSPSGTGSTIRVRHVGGAERYSLRIDDAGIAIAANGADGEFDALVTLAQLPLREGSLWRLACVSIEDAPAMRWRIVSDDVSRGPLPTMHYFKERVRGLAALKANGYSPYMEQVFADPRSPFVPPPEPITAAQLRELDAYSRHFHVALIPEQQTFAHMHETLEWERYAPLAEQPHGYLLAPGDPGRVAYLRPLIDDELRAVPDAPFFHIGSDEPLDLGRGSSAALVARDGRGPVTAAAIAGIAALITLAHVRPMIWDDAIQQDPAILARLSKAIAIVSFHYGIEPTYRPYLDRIANAGFDQFASPGAWNWNEIYPDIDTAFTSSARFIAEAKQTPRMQGLFETVWHDDGESLFEATWYPVAFALASAWQSAPVDRPAFSRDFARTFFASDDSRFASDLEDLAAIRTMLRSEPESDPGNYLFWADPFDRRISDRVAKVDLRALRLRAEAVMTHLMSVTPARHRNAASVMLLAARRYDALARHVQIAGEARAYYDDARLHAGGKEDGIVYRGLNIAKYLCWELRDAMLAIAPLYAAAWRYEDRPYALPRVMERYHIAAQRAIGYADRINTIEREDYLRAHTIPSFDDALGLRK